MASLSANGTYVLVMTEARWNYVLHREKLCLRLFLVFILQASVVVRNGKVVICNIRSVLVTY